MHVEKVFILSRPGGPTRPKVLSMEGVMKSMQAFIFPVQWYLVIHLKGTISVILSDPFLKDENV